MTRPTEQTPLLGHPAAPKPSSMSLIQVLCSIAITGASSIGGYYGANKAFGPIVGAGSILSNWALNADGWFDVMGSKAPTTSRTQHITGDHVAIPITDEGTVGSGTVRQKTNLLPLHNPLAKQKSACCKHFLTAVQYGIAGLSAIPPAFLSGKSAGLVFSNDSLALTLPYALINGLASTIVNIQSLGGVANNIQKFYQAFVVSPYEYIVKDCAGNFQTWHKCILVPLIGVSVLAITYYSTSAAVAATIARGFSTFSALQSFFSSYVSATFATDLAYGGFAISSAPGLAMFISGLSGLYVYILDEIKHLTGYREHKQKVSGSSRVVAILITLFCAVFSYFNYTGLAEDASNGDWALAQFLAGYFFEDHQLFSGVAASASAINLLKRSPNFAKRVEFIVTKIATWRKKASCCIPSLCSGGCGQLKEQCCCLTEVVVA